MAANGTLKLSSDVTLVDGVWAVEQTFFFFFYCSSFPLHPLYFISNVILNLLLRLFWITLISLLFQVNTAPRTSYQWPTVPSGGKGHTPGQMSITQTNSSCTFLYSPFRPAVSEPKHKPSVGLTAGDLAADGVEENKKSKFTWDSVEYSSNSKDAFQYHILSTKMFNKLLRLHYCWEKPSLLAQFCCN